jgi:hypothetical protein
MVKEFTNNPNLSEPSKYKISGIQTQENATIFSFNKNPTTIDSQGKTAGQIAKEAGEDSYAIKFSKVIRGIIHLGDQTTVHFTSDRYDLPGIFFIGGEIVDSREMYELYKPPYDLPDLLKGHPKAIRFDNGALYPYEDNDIQIRRP